MLSTILSVSKTGISSYTMLISGFERQFGLYSVTEKCISHHRSHQHSHLRLYSQLLWLDAVSCRVRVSQRINKLVVINYSGGILWLFIRDGREL